MNYTSDSSSRGKGPDAGRDQPNDSSSPSSSSSSGAAKPSPTEFLPAPNPHAQGRPSPEAGTPVLDVSGAGSTISLDALGPVVVNKDGTVARVGNWAQMTESERQTTLRVLGKRNQQRLAALREAGVELKGMSGGGSSG